MMTALMLSAPGPLITGYAAITSLSATQIADFLRRSSELSAIFVAWLIYRKIQINLSADDSKRAKLERIANMVVGGAMLISGLAMFGVGVARIFAYEATGDVWLGLIIAVLALIVNTGFFIRYRNMIRERYESVISGQQKLYGAKAIVDFFVVIALTSVALAPKHPAIQYIDALGCMIVACYLLYNGRGLIQRGKEGRKFSHQVPSGDL